MVPRCRSPLFLHVDAVTNRVRLHARRPKRPTTLGSPPGAGLDEQPAASVLAVPESFHTELGLAVISPLRLRDVGDAGPDRKRRLREAD